MKNGQMMILMGAIYCAPSMHPILAGVLGGALSLIGFYAWLKDK